MKYVVVIIETESDIPGVDRIFGPYSSEAQARTIQKIAQENYGDKGYDPDLIQVAALTVV